jgi:NADP-dependent 3-hydroxy acid dehydrogenase YdfG
MVVGSRIQFEPLNSKNTNVTTVEIFQTSHSISIVSVKTSTKQLIMSTQQFTTPKRPLTWLITGCSSDAGLGLTLARLAKSKGHIVIATSRNPSRTPESVAEFSDQGCRWVKLDLEDVNCGKVIDELEQDGIHIDVLVNNAGSSIHNSAEQFTEDEVRAQMDLLYFGPYRLMRAVVPFMRSRRFGIIANFSSGAGLEGRETMGTYAAGKAALDSRYWTSTPKTLATSTLTLRQALPKFSERSFRLSTFERSTFLWAGSIPICRALPPPAASPWTRTMPIP